MLESKDIEGFLGNFSGLARRVIGVGMAHQENARPAETIADAARRVAIAAEARESIAEALARVAQLQLDPPPRIVITGSLYLAGEVLAANGTPPE
jgi:dihydrofolate synthase/folylpolyglutamate synthase